MKLLDADLHIHTILSPCGAEEMDVVSIVREASDSHLSIIAICDHNTAGNTRSAQGVSKDICVIAGTEITTLEDVHVVGLFPRADDAMRVGEAVMATLPELDDSAPSWVGPQSLCDCSGKVVGRVTKMLYASSSLSLSKAVALIRGNFGIAIAAHVDRPSFSVMSQLGMMPHEPKFDALEISVAGLKKGRQREFERYGLPILSSSDSHYLCEIGASRTVFEVKEGSFEEVSMAIRGEGGRRCHLA
jgi:hypothetical protein